MAGKEFFINQHGFPIKVGDILGYAQTMEQISGLAWVTGYDDAGPEIPNGACDPIAGGHATVALLLAVGTLGSWALHRQWRRRRRARS